MRTLVTRSCRDTRCRAAGSDLSPPARLRRPHSRPETGLRGSAAACQGRPGVNDSQRREHQRQPKVPSLEPPGRQVSLHIEDGLEPDANSPKHGHVRAEAACQRTPTGKFVRSEDTERCKGRDRQHEVAAIDPIHLPMEPRKALQFPAPVQMERNECGSNQNAELPDSSEENQARERRVHQIAPNACMNGTITPTTNGRWNSKQTGATNTTAANNRPGHPAPSPTSRANALRSMTIASP